MDAGDALVAGGRSAAEDSDEGSAGNVQLLLLLLSSSGVGSSMGCSGVGRGVSSEVGSCSSASWSLSHVFGVVSNSRSKASAQSRGVKGSVER